MKQTGQPNPPLLFLFFSSFVTYCLKWPFQGSWVLDEPKGFGAKRRIPWFVLHDFRVLRQLTGSFLNDFPGAMDTRTTSMSPIIHGMNHIMVTTNINFDIFI
jgi:hypothetical protein